MTPSNLDDNIKFDLIKLVYQSPAIYDKKSPFYGDKVYIDVAWTGITKKLGFEEVTAEQIQTVKNTWRKLRNYFLKTKRSLNLKKTELNPNRTSPWIFFNKLQFLNQFYNLEPTDQSITTASSRKRKLNDEEKERILPKRKSTLQTSYKEPSLSSFLIENQNLLIEDEMQEVPSVVQTQMSSEEQQDNHTYTGQFDDQDQCHFAQSSPSIRYSSWNDDQCMTNQLNSTFSSSYDRIKDPNLKQLCENSFSIIFSLLENKSFEEGKSMVLQMVKFAIEQENK